MNHYANGFDTASLIWKEFMEEAHKDLEVVNFKVPQGITIIPVSIFSGKLPLTDGDGKLLLPDIDGKFLVKEKFASFALPKDFDNSLKIIEVDSVSGKLPTEWTPKEAIEKRAILNFHSYYPDKQNWENSVLDWVNENGREFVAQFGIEKFMYTAPTGEDNVHNAQSASNKPIINIISPEDNGIITPPLVNVRVQISAKNKGVKEVKAYFDEDFQDSSTTYPYDTKIRIPKSASGFHTIRIEAIDNLFYTSSKEIEVKIGSDNNPPILKILYPSGKINISSKLNIMVDAYDNESAIKRIDFYIDGEKFASKNHQPFNLTYEKELEEGEHTLEVVAIDTMGNESRKTKNFIS
jgi:hypothetical protein